MTIRVCRSAGSLSRRGGACFGPGWTDGVCGFGVAAERGGRGIRKKRRRTPGCESGFLSPSRFPGSTRSSTTARTASRPGGQRGVNRLEGCGQYLLKTAGVLFGRQPVADAGVRAQVARPLRVGFDFLAQPRDVDVQVVRFGAVLRAPDLVEQHAVG